MWLVLVIIDKQSPAVAALVNQSAGQQKMDLHEGVPDTRLGSLAVAPVANGRLLTYHPRQTGVMWSVTGNSKQTVIVILAPKTQ